MVGKIFIVSGVIFGCGAYMHHRHRQKERDAARAEYEAQARARAMEEAISGVWSEPRPLIADVETELQGPGVTAAASPATGRQIEVPLTPQAQRNAWSAATHLAREGRTERREQAIRQILQDAVVPGVDWSEGWMPYRGDLRYRDVYEATGDLLDLAELSNKYGPASNPTSDGALVRPGWVHERPAPSADIRPNDYVEVLVGEYSSDPTDELKKAEWAWVKVMSVPKQGDSVAGEITLEAPPGGRSNVLQYSASHGFEPGTALTVPRNCVFRVVKGR